MKVISTKFKNLKVVVSTNFKDRRGYFREIYKKKILKKNNFVFNCLSVSKKNVLRGLHLQTKNSQCKFVSVLKGKIFDVALDLRKNSKTFGKYFTVVLSDKNSKSVLIPQGFAHGFLSLKKENIIYYLCTNYRSKKHEVGIKWNDKDIKIKWPLKRNPILSFKDRKNITFKEFKKKYT